MDEPVPLPSGAAEPEPEPEPETRPSRLAWSSDEKSWEQRFADDFQLDLASLYAKPPHGQRLRLSQTSPWAARDPEADDHEVAHTGLTVWDSSVVLAKYLERECHSAGRRGGLLRGKVVLELGSGAGLVGLAALHLGARKVYCTSVSHSHSTPSALSSRSHHDSHVQRVFARPPRTARDAGQHQRGAQPGLGAGGRDLPAHPRLGRAVARMVPARGHRAGRSAAPARRKPSRVAILLRPLVVAAGGLDVILGADVIYTEEDGEDDEMTKKLLTTIKALFSASRTDVRSSQCRSIDSPRI